MYHLYPFLRLVPIAYLVFAVGLHASAAGESQDEIVNSVGIKLRLIPTGTFLMGSHEGEINERPVHEVRITKSFYLGVTEVTNAQWRAVMGDEPPSKWKDDDRPVEMVSWTDATAFCRKLSELPKEREAGRTYRLPTEAEWEYACRAGTTTKWGSGNDEETLGDVAWFGQNSGDQTHAVAQKRPNAWGLNDMHGNVWEWCGDWYSEYAPDAAKDPAGPADGRSRVRRGGGWSNIAQSCRSSDRDLRTPARRFDNLGFRLALSPPGTEPPEPKATLATASPKAKSQQSSKTGSESEKGVVVNNVTIGRIQFGEDKPTNRSPAAGDVKPSPADVKPSPSASQPETENNAGDVPPVARATLVWLVRFGALEKKFRESFDPVWKTARESKDPKELREAYDKAADLLRDYVEKLTALPKENLDPVVLDYSLEQVAFTRKLWVNVSALAWTFNKICQLREYVDSPAALADALVSGFAGDPLGAAGRVVEAKGSLAREYSSLIDAQIPLFREETDLAGKYERMMVRVREKYMQFYKKLAEEKAFGEP